MTEFVLKIKSVAAATKTVLNNLFIVLDFFIIHDRTGRPKWYKHIQGVTGGTDQTSGECSLGQTIPI